MLIDLLGLTILLEQSSKHAHTPHPNYLLRHTRVGRAASLARARVTALAPRLPFHKVAYYCQDNHKEFQRAYLSGFARTVP